MSQDFEKSAKMVLDAEQQWKESAERASQEIKAFKFHDTSASLMADLEKLEAINFAKNQAPLDMVAELKAINERLDADHRERIEAERDGKKRDRKTFFVAVLTLIATVAIGVITILLQLRQQ